MQLSIIIPTLNEADYIATCVERAKALQPCELVIVDGGSADNTVALASDAGADVITAPRGRGPQLNAGVAHATGDVLLFLHADTWLVAEAREQMELALAKSNVQVGAFAQAIAGRGVLYRWLERGNALRARRWGLAYGDQGIFIRREFLMRHNGFPDVPIMEDLRLMRTLRRHTTLAMLPGPLHVSARRWQRHGVIGQTMRNWLLLAAERCGFSPHRLARLYRPHADPGETATPLLVR